MAMIQVNWIWRKLLTMYIDSLYYTCRVVRFWKNGGGYIFVYIFYIIHVEQSDFGRMEMDFFLYIYNSLFNFS